MQDLFDVSAYYRLKKENDGKPPSPDGEDFLRAVAADPRAFGL